MREHYEEGLIISKGPQSVEKPNKKTKQCRKTREELDLRFGAFFHGILCIYPFLHAEDVL